ncbi:unnamed protein product [Schistocephalus solidus]|uniref:Uncharacterized protein n=1 Tax=Schistocephalus solidus TaxID=70667 RepID=A0A183SL67_SCHSO|nr:unnamed protein product [Schistocephalus solidus]
MGQSVCVWFGCKISGQAATPYNWVNGVSPFYLLPAPQALRFYPIRRQHRRQPHSVGDVLTRPLTHLPTRCPCVRPGHPLRSNGLPSTYSYAVEPFGGIRRSAAAASAAVVVSSCPSDRCGVRARGTSGALHD